jgi:pilus assembly protein CpaE
MLTMPMRVSILSDSSPLALRVREILLREGHECPLSSVVPLQDAARHLTGNRPELVVMVLEPDPEKAIAALQEVRSLIPAQVLGLGPTSDPKLILRVLRAGTDHYLDQDELEPELEAALARFSKRGLSSSKGRVIAVLAPCGGAGSSTLAVNIATLLARDYQSCGLIDLKLYAGDLAALLDLKPEHDLAELCQNKARMDRVMFERSLAKHPSGVHLLGPPQNYTEVGLVDPEGVGNALSMARSIFPYVVVDLDRECRSEQIPVLRQADFVLLVFRLEFAALRNARRTLEYLEILGIARDRIWLVVNRFGQPKEVPFRKAEEALGAKISHYIPDDAKNVNRANNNGVPVVLEAPSAKVSRCIGKLAQSINGKHGK